MTRRIPLLTAILVSLSPILSFAEVRYVRAGDDLQAALDAAQPGDELRLAPEATFIGNFVLPVTPGSSTITIRTDLADQTLPGPRQRVTPAAAARFARIASPNDASALRTAPGAHHWRLMFLRFSANKDGYGDIIQLGDGSTDQTSLSQVPYEIVLDRVYIYGDPLYGQKRGIALNARSVTIRNSYISDIKGVGMDTQAIAGWNGPGPYWIENNYLEAAGENVLFGGADPAIPNLVPTDVTIRSNHIARPMSWRDPIVPAPTGVTAVATQGGSLSAGSYAYRVVARRPVGQGSVGNSLPSAEVTAFASSGAVTVSWPPVAGASTYNVYVRTPSGVTQFWTVAASPFVHNGGTPGRSGRAPSSGTRWQVKNLFELKNARRVRVENNLFENNWEAAQAGYSILLTPRNQDGQCPWCIVEQVDFNQNVIRNVSGGFNITGYDDNGVTGQTNGITIRNNLMYEVTEKLGGSGWPFLLGDEVRDITIDHNTIDFDGTTLLYAYGGTTANPRKITGFRFTNNAARHGLYGINGADASTGPLTFQMFFPSPVFTGNWLSGGSASKYPPGNRFEEPFVLNLPTGTAPATTTQGPGANLRLLVTLMENIQKGVSTEPPQSPRSLRVIF